MLVMLALGIGSGWTAGSATPWWAVGSGGNTSSSTNFRLVSTLAQAAPVGVSDNGTTRLEAGLWNTTPDFDADGVADSLEVGCGTDPTDPGSFRPERIDGVFSGLDDDGDGDTDEDLPAGAENYDCDGDGYKGSAEASTPLCGNGINDDGVIFGGPDDGVADDGCPGGPPQAGAYSEAQFNIGLGDQDPCGLNGWPSDFASGGIPDSTNRVTVTDLTSFLAPVRRLDSSPGHANFNSRWDLVPGRGLFATWINVNDLTALIAGPSGFPPMLGGVKAFGGPACPWAP